jgi:muramoyltetrapeptide carboxypeptidase LdcA involved in peptidoglycan recycling
VPPGLAHWTEVARSDGQVRQQDSGLVATWQPFEEPRATEWKVAGEGRWRLYGADSLDVRGTLIGGCTEVMAGIAGTPYGDVRAFGDEHGDLVVYLEACEDDAFSICRCVHHLRYVGWFDHAVALLVGRTNAPPGTDDGGLTQDEAVLDGLAGLGLPVVFDVEIGHVPPHLPLVNGASARVVVDGDRHEITQTWRSHDVGVRS